MTVDRGVSCGVGHMVCLSCLVAGRGGSWSSDDSCEGLGCDGKSVGVGFRV
jgi:hypothetical protein